MHWDRASLRAPRAPAPAPGPRRARHPLRPHRRRRRDPGDARPHRLPGSRDDAQQGRRVDRDRRAPAVGAHGSRDRRRARRGGRSGSAGPRRQRRAFRDPAARGGPAAARGAAPAAARHAPGRGGPRRQERAARAVRPLRGQLRDRLRPPAAAAPVALAARHAAQLHRLHRPRAHLRLPAGSGAAAQGRARARRQPRERRGDRRDRRAEQQAALRGRVRAPQDPRRDRGPGAAGPPDPGPARGTKAGHALHAAVAAKLVATPGAFELVPAGEVAAAAPVAAAKELRPARA